MNLTLNETKPTRLGIWSRFVFLVIIGVLAILYSTAAGIVALLFGLLILVKPSVTSPLMVAILVWIPMRGIFSANASELVSTAVMAQNIENGDLPRQIAILSLFGIGSFMLYRARFQLSEVITLKCFSAYISLGLLSVLWSANPMLTAKRVIAAISCVVFAAGLSIGYYGPRADGGTRLIRHICLMGSLACLAVLCVAIAVGNFHISDPAWRVGSVGRENQISWVAAITFLAAWATRDDNKIWPTSSALIGILAVTGTVLILGKSRTTIIAACGGMLICELVKRRLRKTGLAITVIAGLLIVIGSSSWFNQFWLRGANDDLLQTASGRTILWQVVWRDICTRPLVGYGYGGYWTPDRVISQEVEWAPTSAHSGYLDTVAQLGFVGFAILIGFIGICSREALKLTRGISPHRHMGIALLAVIVSFIIINLTESYVDSLEYFPMLATLTLCFYTSYLNATTPLLHSRAQAPIVLAPRAS